jgi:hypothetical protein
LSSFLSLLIIVNVTERRGLQLDYWRISPQKPSNNESFSDQSEPAHTKHIDDARVPPMGRA